MEVSKVEKYDKARYRTIFTVFLVIVAFLVTVFLFLKIFPAQMKANNVLRTGLSSLIWLEYIIMIAGVVRMIVFGRRIKRDQELKEVLNDEMYRYNTLRTYRWGWGSAVVACCLGIVAVDLWNMSASFMIALIVVTSSLSGLGAWLIYNR